MNGYVTDFMTGRRVRGFIEDPSAPGKYLCNVDGCRKPTNFHEYAVCWAHTPEPFRALRDKREAAQLFDKEFIRDLRICDPSPISSSRVTVEIVMSGESVRRAREQHSARHRKPLMGERRATGCGEIDLGEIR